MLGRNIIKAAQKLVKTSASFLEIANDIAYYHHEKWDGSGYPEGLAGDAIPISARLMAVADVYDAIISRRAYKGAMSHEKAVAAIREGCGVHFDPELVNAFIANDEDFRLIAEEHSSDTLDAERAAGLSAVFKGTAMV